ncbi:Sec-independent protein translocase protein TatB [Marinibacterium profundimaris]|uniref:Sec-independent protein translocase protein TatB n=1 Tax=Marinibacterium profundimaris TaxID=1679460 RepID=A0A225NSG1_9RHOB|nr:Sec-independent protein translocase protein TatB [Marinibacterium profundimaris]OWU77874.1 preprotein translocase subunit TatB [Marinibacterium profundimaris]
MFDLGWSELLVIGIVALIVVGPKDLPVLFRNVGRFVGKARAMARDFSRAMNDAADETGLRDVASGLKSATNPIGSAMDGVKDIARDVTSSVDPSKYEKGSATGKLAADRAEQAKKIQAQTARAAADRKAREAAEALAKAEAAEAALTADEAAEQSAEKKAET